MQVANALNNTIRILFNPKIEPFKLFDFLMVKSSDDRYLAQIIEIYEDKFDSSQNVAKIKLFYKITQNNEVMPYDNFTPSKECEILKVKPNEVENFINNDKKTFIFATDVKTSQSLNIQYDFFNKNPIILSDKIENSNAVSINLAKKLSSEKNVVLIDYTGIIEFEDAKKIKACKNFKMPLNFTTLDYVFDRCLSDASLEFQAIGIEILNAIKKFAKKQEGGFIPFNAFVNVILQQYKATPYPELQLLLSRMKKYQMFDIFAKNKRDYETFSKTISKNKITIVDLSGLDNIWTKAYFEYITEEIQDEVYLISRINDESFDFELITKIYNEKKNIKFIPSVSYNYAKLPSVIQYCKNYVLMPSLYQRNDFLDANFALSNIISNECILFGENTDNFLYLARDYELETQEKRKNYRKIALSMANGDNTEQANKSNTADSQRLMQELTDLEKEKENIINQEAKNPQDDEKFEEINNGAQLEEIKEQEVEQEEIPQEVKTIKNIQEIKMTNEPPIPIPEAIIENSPKEDEFSNIEGINENKEDIEINENDLHATDENILSEEIPIENLEIFEKANEENQQLVEETNGLYAEDIKQQEEIEKESGPEEENKETILQENQEMDISDEELDFFELAKNSAQQTQEDDIAEENNEEDIIKSDNLENNIIESTQDKNEEDDLDLSEVASSAIENNFEDIINSKKPSNKPSYEIDENTTIEVDLNETKEDSTLPIFKEEENKEGTKNEFKVGGIVIHNKYGKGTIVKVIQYDQRQLLQIDFANSGKKLLDPKIAEIQLEQ